MPVETRADLEILIRLVGENGARAALRAARSVSVNVLRKLVEDSGQSVPVKASRSDLIDTLFTSQEPRLTRTIQDLSRLSEREVKDYIAQSGCNKSELMLFLDTLNIPYEGGRSKTQLIGDAAREISRLGLYQRIANSGSGSAPGEKTADPGKDLET